MSKRFLAGAFAALVSVSLAAQAPAQQPQITDTVTIEGCIQHSVQAPSATAGATGTAGTTATGGPFILANAMKSTSTPGATSTSGSSAASTAIVSTYRLDADDSKLSPHVGHKVEITGTLDDREETSTSPSRSAATAISSPKLKVENVRMIAVACTP
jgi:hypothetical protein